MDDRFEIASQIGALAVHIDGRRWDALKDLFAPKVHADWTSLFGGEPQALTREQLMTNWRQLLPWFTRTTHVIGTPNIAVNCDTAHASASVVAWHAIVGGPRSVARRGTYEIDSSHLLRLRGLSRTELVLVTHLISRPPQPHS